MWSSLLRETTTTSHHTQSLPCTPADSSCPLCPPTSHLACRGHGTGPGAAGLLPRPPSSPSHAPLSPSTPSYLWGQVAPPGDPPHNEMGAQDWSLKGRSADGGAEYPRRPAPPLTQTRPAPPLPTYPPRVTSAQGEGGGRGGTAMAPVAACLPSHAAKGVGGREGRHTQGGLASRGQVPHAWRQVQGVSRGCHPKSGGGLLGPTVRMRRGVPGAAQDHHVRKGPCANWGVACPGCTPHPPLPPCPADPCCGPHTGGGGARCRTALMARQPGQKGAMHPRGKAPPRGGLPSGSGTCRWRGPCLSPRASAHKQQAQGALREQHSTAHTLPLPVGLLVMMWQTSRGRRVSLTMSSPGRVALS